MPPPRPCADTHRAAPKPSRGGSRRAEDVFFAFGFPAPYWSLVLGFSPMEFVELSACFDAHHGSGQTRGTAQNRREHTSERITSWARRVFRPTSPGFSHASFAASPIRRFALSPIRLYPTIAANFKTVFQFRPVPGLPNCFSMSLAVNLDCPTPAG